MFSMALILSVDTESDVLINIFFSAEYGSDDTLESCGISNGSTVYFSLTSFPETLPDQRAFFIDDVVPSVQQSTKGISTFLSSLLIIVSRVL